MVEALEAAAQLAGRLSPSVRGARLLPRGVKHAFFDPVERIEHGLEAASHVAHGVVQALPELRAALGDAAHVLQEGADALQMIARGGLTRSAMPPNSPASDA